MPRLRFRWFDDNGNAPASFVAVIVPVCLVLCMLYVSAWAGLMVMLLARAALFIISAVWERLSQVTLPIALVLTMIVLAALVLNGHTPGAMRAREVHD